MNLSGISILRLAIRVHWEIGGARGRCLNTTNDYLGELFLYGRHQLDTVYFALYIDSTAEGFEQCLGITNTPGEADHLAERLLNRHRSHRRRPGGARRPSRT